MPEDPSHTPFTASSDAPSPHPDPLPANPGEGTRIDASTLIRRVWRGVWSARLARFGLLSLAIAGFLLARDQTLPAGMGLLFATAAAWVLLVTRTARNQQDLLRVAAWIEAGRYELAEAAVNRSLVRFSVAVRPRLHALRHLALSRNAQHLHADARLLATASLGYRSSKTVADAMRLIVAEAALAGGDLVGAHAALSGLVAPLPLRDSLKVLELQTDYCIRVAAWPHAAHDLPGKVELAELLPADNAAVVQALLALAARRLGYTNWAIWLSRRAALLADPATLVSRRPILAELWATGTARAGQVETPA